MNYYVKHFEQFKELFYIFGEYLLIKGLGRFSAPLCIISVRGPDGAYRVKCLPLEKKFTKCKKH